MRSWVLKGTVGDQARKGRTTQVRDKHVEDSRVKSKCLSMERGRGRERVEGASSWPLVHRAWRWRWSWFETREAILLSLFAQKKLDLKLRASSTRTSIAASWGPMDCSPNSPDPASKLIPKLQLSKGFWLSTSRRRVCALEIRPHTKINIDNFHGNTLPLLKLILMCCFLFY